MMGHCCQEVREDIFLIVLVFGFMYSFSLDKRSGKKYISALCTHPSPWQALNNMKENKGEATSHFAIL